MSRQAKQHWHPKPHPLPYLYGSFFYDHRRDWLDNPWSHVVLIVVMLVLAGILIFFLGGPP